MIDAPYRQVGLFSTGEHNPSLSRPVQCLGLTFANDEERRKYFTEKLREKLQDPEFRKSEGFPFGTDEDILALSDPPYYTACPNPWLGAFIKEWEAGRVRSGECEVRSAECEVREDGETHPAPRTPHYHREPFAVDTSEGKTHALYKAHSYHTKVPHLAIVPSLLHYTEPGDIVLDGFCGSGMTGVAAQWCGAAPQDYRRQLEAEWAKEGREKPQWGARRVVLNDLSPAATFIAANYNLPFDVQEFARAARQLLDEVERELGWMYDTLHSGAGILPARRLLERLSLSSNFKTPIHQFKKTARDLPHWQYPGAILSITFNTYQRKELSSQSRDIVFNALKFWHGKKIQLLSAVVMPDHAHAVFQLVVDDRGSSEDLSKVMHSIKSFSANEINKLEGWQGQILWQNETYDHIVRNDEDLNNILNYIYWNPIRKGLCERTEEYSWYHRDALMEDAGWKPAPLGRIEYTVWSEVFTCPDCAGEVVFLKEALDAETKRVRDAFPCPHCGAELKKDNLERVFESTVDPAGAGMWKRVKFRPCLISYAANGQRYEKQPDEADLALLDRITQIPLPSEVPTNRFPLEQMYHGSRIEPKGFSNIHHFFLPRAGQALAALWRKANAHPEPRTRHMLLFFVEQAHWTISILNRYRPTGYSQVNQYLTGVYYVASQHAECSPWYILNGKLERLAQLFTVGYATYGAGTISTGTASLIALPDASIDYIFTDPPFGENIYYADLNFLVESWHRVITNATSEAIVDKFKKKGLPEYQHLMRRCFLEYYRVLKPGHWMTVVFHNSHNSVWIAIQEALTAAGFVVASVSTLNKQQGSYRQVTSAAMKEDLVVSTYKPNDGLEERFALEAGTEDGAWDFVRSHLRQLPVIPKGASKPEIIAERLEHRLYDLMVAFHVQRGFLVPLSAAEFALGLSSRENLFTTRDDMWFLAEQVTDYDRWREKVKDLGQYEGIPRDEVSAVQWLRLQLKVKPQTLQDLTPLFLRLTNWLRYEKPIELSLILEQNFLRYDGLGPVPEQIHAHLSTNWKDLRNLSKDNPTLVAKAKDRWYVPDPNKAGDLEKLREKALLKEFDEYKHATKKLKIFRLEAVRAGFKKAWQERDYTTIISVADKISHNVLEEDPKLLMWYDQAITRMGGN